jgi:hypothetical protein
VSQSETLYKLRFRDSTGALIAELGYSHQSSADNPGVSWLSYYRHVYGTGLLQMALVGTLPWLSDFDENGQVEVWRKVADEDWALDFLSINVDDFERTWPDGTERFVYQGPGENDLLARAHVLWFADTANRSAFTAQPAETVMKTLVTYNAVAASATIANGRQDDFTSAFTLTVQADGAAGNTIDTYCAWANLLKTLQDVARVGGGDYSLTRDPASAGAYTTFRFDWHLGQLGTDRTATVIFALTNGNMGEPKVRRRALNSPTTATVGGPGEGAARLITVRDASNHAATRHRETFVNASNAQTVAARQSAGDAALDRTRPRVEFEWTAIQTGASRYGQHYFLGDLVTAVRPDTGTSTTQKIMGVRVALSEQGDESVVIDTEEQ